MKIQYFLSFDAVSVGNLSPMFRYSIWDHPDDRGNKLSRNVGDYQPTQLHSPEDVSVHHQHYKNIKGHSFAIWFIFVFIRPIPFRG